MEKHSSEKGVDAKKGGSKPWSSETPNNSDWRKREFERKRIITCYNCQKPGHISTNCTEPKKDLRFVNNLAMDQNFAPSFKPFLSQAKVNHVDTVVLRDTGSSIDLSPIHLINAEDFTGEKVWVKQPLDNEFRSLPLARIILETPEFGTVFTNVAIVRKSVKMGHYLLGNSTQELIDAYKNNPQSINAVVTRSQSKREVKGVTDESNGSQKTEIESSEVAIETEVAGMINLNETNLEMDEEDEPIKLPPADVCPLQKLVEVNAEEFLKAQKDCPNLKSLWEKVALGKTTDFEIERELLFRKSTDHHGFERKQLLIPAKYKFKVLSLCHEGFGCHMGTTKTKDKLLRYYFWPQCIKKVEEFVKTCDACQRVGKSSERKEAPLKLTPVVSEVFSKVNLDTVGPLPVSTKNNRYLLTYIDLASKYPEAIPLETIASESITDALLLIFSRIGYPREVQLDNASSFTSNLTTTFFEKFGMKITGFRMHSTRQVLHQNHTEGKEQPSPLFRGLVFALFSGISFSIVSVIVKEMENLHPGQLALYRFISTFILSMPETAKTGQNPLGPPRLRFFLILRGVFGGFGYFMNFIAFRYLSMSEASVIVFSTPVIVTIFARIIFKEPCNIFQSISVIVTVLGIVFTTKLPTHLNEKQIAYSSEKIYGLVAAIFSLFCISAMHLITRKIRIVHQSIITFNYSWVGTLGTAFLTAVLGNFKWHLCGIQSIYILLLALFSYSGLTFLVLALQCEYAGPVSTVRAAADIGLAFVWQIFIFHDIPDFYGIMGAILVLVSIIFISLGKWLNSLEGRFFSCKKFKCWAM
ncbi:unnamed protein product [Larinioides sclopetarius]|uniref:RNA-directed DNA polymerase n=1 Tax=Larinioides sclopetarius TaxID=280406 RepID=A0AAV2BNK5_9ARAC